jgi:hypothetical protein
MTTDKLRMTTDKLRMTKAGDWVAFADACVHVEMPQERFRDLALHKGEQVYVTPRELAVFTNDRP